MLDRAMFYNWAQQYGPPEILDEEAQQMNSNEQLQEAYNAGYYRALNEQTDLHGNPFKGPSSPTDEPNITPRKRWGTPPGGGVNLPDLFGGGNLQGIRNGDQVVRGGIMYTWINGKWYPTFGPGGYPIDLGPAETDTEEEGLQGTPMAGY